MKKFIYHEDISKVIDEKNDLVRGDRDRRDDERVVRAFYNGEETMSEEEAEDSGREEITNHLFGHRHVKKLEAKIYQIYTAPGNLVTVKVDTDTPERDTLDTVTASKCFSKAVKKSGELSSLIRSIAGELAITGRAPINWRKPYGWCPKMAPNLLLPAGTPLHPRGMTYAFSPVEMNLRDLKDLKETAGGGELIKEDVVDELIEMLERQMEGDSKARNASDPRGGHEHPEPVSKKAGPYHSARQDTVNLWWYYEVKRGNGTTSVDAVLLAEGIRVKGEDGDSTSSAKVVADIPKLFEDVGSWLHLLVLGTEVGGVKTYDSTKGMAEINYNTDLDTEELVNVMIEGDKARSLPRVQRTDEYDESEVLSWDATNDSEVPKGLKEFRVGGTSQNLLTPIGLLMNNSAELGGGTHQNVGRDQQLRVQALAAQTEAARSEDIQMEDVYEGLDSVFEEIFHRFCTADIGNMKREGSEDIAYFRAKMDKAGIDYKVLGERLYGHMENVAIRVRRVNGGGQESAQFLFNNISAYKPEVRPLILQKATAIATNDAELAEDLVQLPTIIVNEQKTIAENEYDTMRRRASLGQPVPINVNDIDEDHIPVHLVDLQAHIAEHQFEPWKTLDIVAFQLGQRHVEMHIQTLLSSPATNKGADEFIRQVQALATAGDAIIAETQQREQEEQAAAQQQEEQPSQKEVADVQLKEREVNLKERQVNMAEMDLAGTQNQREKRGSIAERSQSLKEGVAQLEQARKDRDEVRKAREKQSERK